MMTNQIPFAFDKKLPDGTTYFSAHMDPQGRTINGKPVVIGLLNINPASNKKKETAEIIITGFVTAIRDCFGGNLALCVIIDGSQLKGIPSNLPMGELRKEQSHMALQVVASDNLLIETLINLFRLRNAHLFKAPNLNEAQSVFDRELAMMAD